jgi:hypothetical protein
MVGVVIWLSVLFCFEERRVSHSKTGVNNCITLELLFVFDRFSRLFLQSVVYPQLLCVRFSQSMVHIRCALHLYHGTAGGGSGFSFVGLSALLGL